VRAIHLEYVSAHTEPATARLIAGVLGGWSSAAAEATAVTAWLRRTRCALGGHAMMLRFEPGRLSLRCQSCGRQTTGWAIGR
jgi:hypothetical protein